MMGVAFGRGWGSGGSSFIEESIMFFSKAGITDVTQKKEINRLVKSLMSHGLWRKFSVIYPLIGGAVESTAINLSNTEKHQILWNGDEYFTPEYIELGWSSVDLQLHTADVTDDIQNSLCAAIYSANEVQSPAFEWGTYPDGSSRIAAHMRYTDSKAYYDHGASGATGRVSAVISESTKLMVFNKLNTTQSVYRDGSLIVKEDKSISVAGGNLRLNTRSDALARRFSFIAFGQGLTATEIADLTNIVNTFQTNLGRNV